MSHMMMNMDMEEEEKAMELEKKQPFIKTGHCRTIFNLSY